jgi:hypothetical protein
MAPPRCRSLPFSLQPERVRGALYAKFHSRQEARLGSGGWAVCPAGGAQWRTWLDRRLGGMAKAARAARFSLLSGLPITIPK